MNVGELFVAWRRARGLSQDAAAKELGVTRLTLGRYEGGKREAPGEMVAKLLLELGSAGLVSEPAPVTEVVEAKCTPPERGSRDIFDIEVELAEDEPWRIQRYWGRPESETHSGVPVPASAYTQRFPYKDRAGNDTGLSWRLRYEGDRAWKEPPTEPLDHGSPAPLPEGMASSIVGGKYHGHPAEPYRGGPIPKGSRLIRICRGTSDPTALSRLGIYSGGKRRA